MKLFYNPSGTVKVLPVSVLPVNAVWNGGFPYTPEGSLLVSIVSAKPTDTVSNGGFIQELWGGVCAGYDTPSIWIGGLAITSYGALCLDVDGGIVTDGPALYNSLTHTAIPARGSIVPSFTRATTATGQKWDEAGYLDFTALAGEAVFKGARRERNLLTFPEDFSNAAWTKINGGAGSAPTVTSGFTDPDGGTTAWRLQANAGGVTGSDYSVVRQSIASAITYGQRSIYIKSNTGVSQVVYFGAAESDDSVTATTEWQQLAVLDSASSVLFDIGCYRPSGVGSGAQSIDVLIWHPNLANITGETDQTTIRPYVSVGVESAPAYHGSMVDGVKCFPTDLSGNPIPSTTLLGYQAEAAATNLNTYSNDASGWGASGVNTTRAQVTGPDGASNSAIRLTETATTDFHYDSWPTIAKAASAIQYTFSFLAKKGTRDYVGALIGDSAGNFSQATFNLNTGVISAAAANTGTFTSSSAGILPFGNGWYLVWITATTNTGVNVRGYPIMSNDGTNLHTYLGDITKYVDVTGGQIETGSIPTSRIRTTTVAVARNAAVDQYPTTAGPIAAVGSISLDFTPYHAPSGTIALWGTYVDASNYTAILHDATNLIFRKRIAGSNYDATIANAFVSGTTYKVAATWGAAGTAIYLDGVAGTPHANTTAAQIAATMQVGADGNSLQQPGAGTTNLRIWQRQLSSPEGVAVTA